MNRAQFTREFLLKYHPNLKRVALGQVAQGAPGDNSLVESAVSFEQYEDRVLDKQFVVLWNEDGEGGGQAFIPVDRVGLKNYLGDPIENLLEKPR